MIDEVLARKAESLERCVDRAREEYTAAGNAFESDYTRQDAAILNILRGCEAAIDMANRMISLRQLSLPRDSKDSFKLLRAAGVIDEPVAEAMSAMIGFRNIAVQEYRKVELDRVRKIIEHRLVDLLAFSKAMLRADPSP